MKDTVKFSDLRGKTLTSIDRRGDEEIYFHTSCGKVYHMHHHQSCCENVYIDDINGDLNDLIGVPIMSAAESTEDKSGTDDAYYDDLVMFTFYHIRTIKGDVTIRWNGSSNGYYSVSVDFEEQFRF